MSPRRQQPHDDHLRHCHHDARQPRRIVNTEQDRQRTHARRDIALDCLEIIERHDAVRTQTVKPEDDENFGRRQRAEHHTRAGKPCEALIGQRDQRRSPPAISFQAERRRAVHPCTNQPKRRSRQNPRPRRPRDNQRQNSADDRNPQAPIARDPPRWNRPVRFVDRIDMPVKPIIHGLRGSAHQRPGQQHARDQKRPAIRDRNARRHDATHERPHRRKPGNRLEQSDHIARRRKCRFSQRCRRPIHESKARLDTL